MSRTGPRPPGSRRSADPDQRPCQTPSRGHPRRHGATPEIAVFPGLPERVAFHRTELSLILGLYGRMVAAGLWRDYAISMLREVAVFSVFRHTAEHPLYRIEKRPASRAGRGNMR